ncbi:MAG: hypothetical protein PHT79_05500 [Syntrophomonadaceae bacterium]|nr:hypothetical protein [Syntrophomonadaceae bacterium]MDD3888447.1 hypothetical protein [Syntrophomonadaceae bacterium]MDD4549200.1 hypothetical protein [Syntrophomonadaceae bacterium]
MNYKKLSAFIVVFLMSFIIHNIFVIQPALASDGETKVVLYIMDYVDVSDIIHADTPNLDKLIKQSGTGLMNVRAKNMNPSSAYMSLSAGARVGTIANAALSYNSDEIVNELPGIFTTKDSTIKGGEFYALFTGKSYPDHGVVNIYTEQLKKISSSYNPVYQIGQIGSWAREMGLTIAVLGNADSLYSINRNAALLTMDENGSTPIGYVSKDLLTTDPTHPGGVRADHKQILQKFDTLLDSADILVVDPGDTTRVESSRINCADNILTQHRKNAIEKNDLLLGEILSRVNMNNTMMIILTPNPSNEMLMDNNLGLTPIIMYTPHEKEGLLTSPTTRRTGLVSNSDLLPAIFNYFDFQISSANTGITTIKKTDNSLEKLNNQLKLYKNLRESRNPLHYTFMLMALLTLLGGFFAYIKNDNKLVKLINPVIYSTLSIPIVFLFISYTGYASLAFSIMLTLLLSALIGGLIAYLIKEPANGLLLLTGITMVLLTLDVFTGSRLMLLSPLGSDAIAGGRFYGIGNDYMGVLIASTIIFISLLTDRIHTKLILKILIATTAMIIMATAIGHPHFGANVGGLITSIVATGVLLMVLMEKQLNLKLLVIIGLIAIAGVLTVARLDALFSTAPSHAGKAISMLFNGGFPIFVSIIRTKLGILAGTVYHSSWSIFLLLSIIILVWSWFSARSSFLRIAVEQSRFAKIIRALLITAITVFIANDTGVIAAAFITLYAICCLWLAMYYSKSHY